MLSLLFLLPAMAQDTTLTWQGRLTDSAGAPLNSSHNLTFTLQDDGGQQLWSKTVDDVALDGGYASVTFGGDDDNTPARALDPAWLLADTWLSIAVDAQPLGVSQRLNTVGQAAATVGAVQLTSSPTCESATEGALRWTGTALQTCNGSTWVSTGSGGIGAVGSQANGDGSNSSNPGHSCQTIQTDHGASADQGYWIDPDGAGGRDAFLTHCDMSGGGWTRILNITGGTGQWTGTARESLWSDGMNLSGNATSTFSQLTNSDQGFVGWARLAGYGGRTVEMRVQGTNELGQTVDETYTLYDFEVEPYNRYTEVGGMQNGLWTVAHNDDVDVRTGWGVCGTGATADAHIGFGLCDGGYSGAIPSGRDVQIWHYGNWSSCPNITLGQAGTGANYTYTCNRGAASVTISMR